MDETLRAVINYVLAFVFGYLSRYIEPRVRLVHCWPGFFTFTLPVPNPAGGPQTVDVSTHALTIQNLGWRTANNDDIIHGHIPQIIRIQQHSNFTYTTPSDGEP